MLKEGGMKSSSAVVVWPATGVYEGKSIIFVTVVWDRFGRGAIWLGGCGFSDSSLEKGLETSISPILET